MSNILGMCDIEKKYINIFSDFIENDIDNIVLIVLSCLRSTVDC